MEVIGILFFLIVLSMAFWLLFFFGYLIPTWIYQWTVSQFGSKEEEDEEGEVTEEEPA